MSMFVPGDAVVCIDAADIPSPPWTPLQTGHIYVIRAVDPIPLENGNYDKNILKKSQLAWIRERDAQCTTDTGIDVQCRLSTTQERNNWLRERLRECKTIGCKTNALN